MNTRILTVLSFSSMVLMLALTTPLIGQSTQMTCGYDYIKNPAKAEKPAMKSAPSKNPMGCKLNVCFHSMEGNYPNFSDQNPDHEQYLLSLIYAANNESFNNPGYPETCGVACEENPPFIVNETGNYMSSTGIELQFGNFQSYSDPQAQVNYGNSIFASGQLMQNFITGNPEYENCLNVFLLNGATCDGGTVDGYCGVGHGSHIVLNGQFDFYLESLQESNGESTQSWNGTMLLVHEIGHTLGLGHIWNDSDINDNGCTATDWVPNQNDPNLPLEEVQLTECWTGGSNNAMSYCAIKRYFTDDQIARMNTTLASPPQSNFLDCTPCGDWVVSTNYTIEANETVNACGDVYIQDGVTLTIKGTLVMPHNQNGANIINEIIVEDGGTLIVDGGLIIGTPLNFFEGIKMRSNSSVSLINNATIYGARIGISKPEFQSVSNKTLYVNEAHFVNCFIGISMDANIPCQDNSFIYKTTFTGNDEHKRGIMLHNIIAETTFILNECTFSGYPDVGIRLSKSSLHGIVGNKFNNIDNGGIYSENSYFRIHGSTFESMPTGIRINNSNTNFQGPFIGAGDPNLPNRFLTSEVGILVNQSNTDFPLYIQTNYFKSSLNGVGIRFNGTSSFGISRNIFENLNTAVEIHDSGITQSVSTNNINDNYFTEVSWNGIVCNGNNPLVEIKENCFNSLTADITITGQTGIMPNQGSSMVSAGNCFSNYPNTFAINNMSDTNINYYGLNDGSCYEPLYNEGVTVISSALGNVPNCDQPPFFDEGPTHDVTEDECNCDYFFLTDLSTSIDEQEQEMIDCTIDQFISEIDSICETNCDTRFASGSFTSGPNSLHIDNEFDCDSLYSETPDRTGRKNLASGIYGLWQWLEDGAGEDEHYDPECLKVIIHSDAECKDFSSAFGIDGEKWTLFDLIDSLEINFGAEISITHYPNYDSAEEQTNSVIDCSSLDNIISDSTGVFKESDSDCFEVELGSDYRDQNDNMRKVKNQEYRKINPNIKTSFYEKQTFSKMKESMHVFPNPFNSELNIELERSSDYEIVITNTLSKTILLDRIIADNVLKINTSHWKTGIYFVQCYDIQTNNTWIKKVIMTQ